MDLLPCVEVGPAQARSSVIWLHGLGASGHDFEEVVPLLQRPDLRFVFPHAPFRPVTVNGGYVMRSWYDIRHLDFDAPDREDEGDVLAATAWVEALVAAEGARGVPADRVVLVGFSQGAALALHTALRHPTRLAGLAVLSGYRIRPHADGEWHPANAHLPVLVHHGRFDDVVPPAAGDQVADRLRAAGHPVRHATFPMAHALCEPQVAALAAWLSEQVPAVIL